MKGSGIHAAPLRSLAATSRSSIADVTGSLERITGRGERALNVTAEVKNGQNDDRGNRGDKQAVFDRRGTAFVFDKASHKVKHYGLSCQVACGNTPDVPGAPPLGHALLNGLSGNAGRRIEPNSYVKIKGVTREKDIS